MNPETKIPEAKTIGEINTHLGFISAAVGKLAIDIKDTQTQLTQAVKDTQSQIANLGTSFVTHLEFDPVKKQHEKNTDDIAEMKDRWSGLMGKMVGGGLVLGALWAIITLFVSYYFHL